MKQLKVTKRSSFIFISVSFVSLCVIGVIVQQSVFSSRVVLKDELQIHRKLLHNGKGEHACDCYSPFIDDFEITDITSEGASFIWVCDKPSTYQVKWGTSTAKDNYFPEDVPDVFYTEYTVVLTGLDPGTKYYVGPSSICDYYSGNCTNLDIPNLRKNEDINGKSTWNFTTLDNVTYTISGAVLAAAREGIPGVLVTLSGDDDATVTTTDDGTYEFANLLPGDYTVTPTKDLFSFDPPFIEYTSLNSNQTDKDFTGDATSILTNDVTQTTIYEAKVAKITAKDVTITWKTNRSATSLIEYGLTTAYGIKSPENTILEHDHVIQLFGLQAGATYHARAISKDASTGKAISSRDFTFETPISEDRIVNLKNVFNEPNPCFNRTMFVYYLYQPVKRMTIDIFTLSGKTVATLEAPESTLKAGYNKVLWDLRNNAQKRLPTGLYAYKMTFHTANNNQVVVKKSNLMVRK